MGQQQLLLVILVTIIVGVATVVAVNTFQKSRVEANRAAIRQDIIMILNDAQIYYKKPKVMGGGGQSFDTISQDQILSIEPTNENGSYAISGSGNTVTVIGTSQSTEVKLTAEAAISTNGMDISWTESIK